MSVFRRWSHLLGRTVASFGATILAVASVSTAALAQAPVPKTLCVYDPGGKVGDAYKFSEKYQAAAVAWGANFTLKVYTDESAAAADFRNKQCSATIVTGVRAQLFNRKTYSVEALGLLPTYDLLEKAVSVLAQPRAASLNVSGEFETAGIIPAGAVYLFVRQREQISLAKLAGKRIATISFDNSARFMVNYVGASVVPAEIGTFASMFNDGAVDVCYAPATAYEPLELSRGVGTTGGMVQYPITQLTLQVLIRTADMPVGFGQKSREYISGQFRTFLGVVKASEARVPAASRLSVPAADQPSYVTLLADVRHKLRDQGAYDPTMITLLEKLATTP